MSLLVLLLAACTSSPDADAEVQVQVQVQVGPTPTVATLSWSSPDAQEAWVEYGLDGALDLQTPVHAAANEHSVLVLGMKAGRTYAWRAVQRAHGVQTVVGEGELDIAPPPPELARLDIVSSVEGAHEGGYVLTSQISAQDAYVAIFDREGDPVWFTPPEAPVVIPTARPSMDGSGISFAHNDRERTEDLGGVMRVSMDGAARLHTRNVMGHHDFAETPDGKVAWISFTSQEVEVVGYDTPQLVTADRILEAPLGTDDPQDYEVIFDFFEDWHEPFELECRHQQADHYVLEGSFDYSHCNSLMYDQTDDTWLMMCKNLDALFKINRSTGEILWRAGRGGDLEISGDSRWNSWSHGHMSHYWGDGMVVFDNGYHHEALSRVLEYAVDEDARTLKLVWEYVDPDERFVPLLGDGRKLPSGNVLSAWTNLGILKEITPAGEVVWEAEADLGQAVGRVRWIEDLYDLPSP